MTDLLQKGGESPWFLALAHFSPDCYHVITFLLCLQAEWQKAVYSSRYKGDEHASHRW